MKNKLSQVIEKIPGEYIPWVGVGAVTVIVAIVHFLITPLF